MHTLLAPRLDYPLRVRHIYTYNMIDLDVQFRYLAKQEAGLPRCATNSYFAGPRVKGCMGVLP